MQYPNASQHHVAASCITAYRRGVAYLLRYYVAGLTVVAALGLAACGGDGDGDEGSGGTPVCSTLVGDTVEEDAPDCTSDDGAVVFMGYDDCDDGRSLWASDEIHGFVGEEWQAGDWQPAHAECYP